MAHVVLLSSSFVILSMFFLILPITGEYSRDLEISEGVPIGTRIGFIGDGFSGENGPPYLIIPVQGIAVDNDLEIDQKTGEIKTKTVLDRESRQSYYFVAVLLNGRNIHVTVKVIDENDNAPTFPTSTTNVEFPENTPRDVKRTLHPAKDPDIGIFNTQKYNIVSGNVNNAFKLSYHREKDGVLYPDLQVNGPLDREQIAYYSLIVEAVDGGTPPLRAVMTVNVTIQDVNDNPPLFDQTRYYATIAENATVGTNVLKVYANDSDEGDNAVIEYSINRRQSDRERYFVVDADNGQISVNKLLDFETKDTHELVIVARDRGLQPLESTAFVTIRITDVNDNQPIINLIFLSDDATPKISEAAESGEFVARISVNDPDSRTEYSNVNVSLEGGDGHFGLTTRDNVVYLVIVAMPLDREQKSDYTLRVIATDNGTPPLHAWKTFDLRVTDVNDNAPEFASTSYYANVLEIAEPGTSVLRVTARDKDEGPNGRLNYFILNNNNNNNNNNDDSNRSIYSSWFQIDSETGLITTRAHVDCELDPVPKLIVTAVDAGQPPLSSSTTVYVTVHDVNDNEPIFAKTFYRTSVPEDTPAGSCILQVQATDSDCGINAEVNYTLQESWTKGRIGWPIDGTPIYIKSVTGEICISSELDYENRKFYEFTVTATDRGGLSAVSSVLIEITDVNDNPPVFYPAEYKISASYFSTPSSDSPTSSNDEVGGAQHVIGLVKANDPDTDSRFASISYRLSSSSLSTAADYFRVDDVSGDIYLLRSLRSSYQQINNGAAAITREFVFNVTAIDGIGLKSSNDAKVIVYLTDDLVARFERSRYVFNVPEDAALNTPVGSIKLSISRDVNTIVRYFIIYGDADGYFSIDPLTGIIKVASVLDYEKHPYILLNIQAIYGSSTSDSIYTQALITLEDKNDNAPEFQCTAVRISIPENTSVGSAIYVAHATDSDSGTNGYVRYYLNTGNGVTSSSGSSSSSMILSGAGIPGRNNHHYSADSSFFRVNAVDGSLILSSPLDYESNQRHTLLIVATDEGQPTLASNVTVLLEVQDVNDNPPVFERTEYPITVSESLPVNSKVVQVTAIDLDTGNNAKITYKLLRSQPVDDDDNDLVEDWSDQEENLFGVYANSGWVYTKKQLDREKKSVHFFRLIATDNGLPRNTATTTITVTLTDANDNAPTFSAAKYDFLVEENSARGTIVGKVPAMDEDIGLNSAIVYSLIPANCSFQINQHTGEISTKEPLDREYKSSHEFVAEARDQGIPSRSSRVTVKVTVTDVNDNAPTFMDPQEDVVSIREQQPPGIEVARVRATDPDEGHNSSVTYSILKGRDTDGHGVFMIDPISGMIRTRSTLDHEDRSVYRVAVAATDKGQPPKQTVRILRIEVLDLNDNRPTFTSSSLVFKVREDVPVGYTIGNVIGAESSSQSNRGNTVYTLTYVGPFSSTASNSGGSSSVRFNKAFDIDRRSGWLIVAEPLDRETCDEYKLEIRAIDTSTSPQSSVIVVKIEITDVNDNAPVWERNPLVVRVSEDAEIGTTVWNFTAVDSDFGPNAEIRYVLISQRPSDNDDSYIFAVDSLTGSLIIAGGTLDFESIREYVLVIRAIDQAPDPADRLSASLTVRIVVTDVNDNKPIVRYPSNGSPSSIVYVTSSAVKGAFVSRIVADDPDSGDNGRLTYVISAGNEHGYFAVGYDTGVITVNKPFHKNARSASGLNNFAINVTVSDHGSPTSLSGTACLNITLKTVSAESQLRFLQSVYHVNVTEDMPIGSVVLSVSAHFTGHYYNGYETDRLSYRIPNGVANDTFSADDKDGLIRLRRSLDRERSDEYVIPVYVNEPRSKKSDFAVVIVHVSDVNDNKPSFKTGSSCYPLWIPENAYNDSSFTVHTFAAYDADSELNAKLLYTITGGNIAGRFNIDSHSGELTALPLDREIQSRYQLTITAQDQGTNPNSLTGSCNVTVHVEDENDSEPRFEKSLYKITIPENTPVGSTVLTVTASDSDANANAQIVYILRNESDWLFRIHNRTGVIVLAGELDRETKDFYTFQVTAMDTAHYRCLSQTTNVQITIDDVNDDRPRFVPYPFVSVIANVSRHLHPNVEIVKLIAVDRDAGLNGDVVYRFSNERYDVVSGGTTSAANNKFRLNPTTGAISTFTSLAADLGKTFYLEVTATDKGNPPLSSIALIEIGIGEESNVSPALRFQNASYEVSIFENSSIGENILQVFALRSDGRRQKIVYSFGSGNEEGAFEIHPYSGMIRIRNSSVLDYESNPLFVVVIVAETENNPTGGSLYAFADLTVRLIDRNDNVPIFSQDQYFAAIPEANTKSIYVLQVLALDADEGSSGKVSYHIVDGNHDNAFMIEPSDSNVVKTNIVLDAEIRDTYKITVIATDQGTPQLTGTATIRINVIDINDNQPSFPPSNPIKVSEYAQVGSTLTTVTANDVDSYPPLVYAIDEFSESDEDGFGGMGSIFAIDRYSGRITLKTGLDYEQRTGYKLTITAYDGLYLARTNLDVTVLDENDNRPIFSQLFYQFILSENPTSSSWSNSRGTTDGLMTVSATDLDSGDNGRVTYSLVSPVTGFTIDKQTGIITVNYTAVQQQTVYQGYFDLLVKATDAGKPSLSSIVPVRFETRYSFQGFSSFSQSEYRISIKEDTAVGTILLNLNDNPSDEDAVYYSIIGGNEECKFDIINPGGSLILVNRLDRETTDIYSLEIGVDRNISAATIHVTIDDVNDNAPLFKELPSNVTVSENATPNDTILLRLSSTDDDLPPNSDVRYRITSGNDEDLFALNSLNGLLTVNKRLDYDGFYNEYVLIVAVEDRATRPEKRLTNVAELVVRLTDENDNAPSFPIGEYYEFIGENEPIGTSVFTAKATDYDKGIYGRLNYSIVSSGFGDVDDSWKLFRVDVNSGLVTSNVVFDYETRTRYAFTILSCDVGAKCAKVKTKIEIESRDEFHPQFTERTYRFTLYDERPVVVGRVIGHVTATDRDKGPDGRVVYQLTGQNPYFKINRTTGAITIKKKFDDRASSISYRQRDIISLVVTASSGRQGSLTNVSVVEIVLDADTLSAPGVNLASNVNGNVSNSSNLTGWLIGLLTTFVLIGLGAALTVLALRVRKRKRKTSGNGGSKPSNFNRVDYVDHTSAFDTIPIRSTVIGNGPPPSAPSSVSQFGPPKYDEIPTYRANDSSNSGGAPTTSELSEQSSGRGSAEDAEDVDEEIRMINENSRLNNDNRDNGDDNLSDVSVHNTQEYLARLGIVDTSVSSNENNHKYNNNNNNNNNSHHHRRPTVVTSASSSSGHHNQYNRMNNFDEPANNETDIANIIYAKLNDHTTSDNNNNNNNNNKKKKDNDNNGSVIGGRTASSSVDHGMALEACYSQIPATVGGTQPSMSGSLSSIVHSEEELTGSYNWDYLLDWGPQYQPLAHVFSEIARLKDDAGSVKSGTTTSSGKSKTVPPPNLTNVAPRSVVAPILSNRPLPSTASTMSTMQHSTPLKNQLLLLPRSPISHDAVSDFSTSAAMSPSFSPSLSPLAARSPSNSPLHLHSVNGNNNNSNNNSNHIVRSKHHHRLDNKDVRI